MLTRIFSQVGLRANKGKVAIFPALLLIVVLSLLLSGCATASAPGVSLTIDPQSTSPKQVTSGVQLLVLMTVLSLAPAVLILATSLFLVLR